MVRRYTLSEITSALVSGNDLDMPDGYVIDEKHYDALAAELAAWKTIVGDLNAGCVINEDRIRDLEATLRAPALP